MTTFDAAWQRMLVEAERREGARQVLETAADAGRIGDLSAAAVQVARDPAGSIALLSSLEDPRVAERAAAAAGHELLHDYLVAGR